MDECHTSLTYKEYRPMIMGDVVRCVRRADSFDEDTSDWNEGSIGDHYEMWDSNEGDRAELKYRMKDASKRVSSRDDLNREVKRILRSKLGDFVDEESHNLLSSEGQGWRAGWFLE